MTITSKAWPVQGAALHKRSRRSRSFAGIISLLAGIALVTDMVWLIMSGQLFMLQLPILLGSLVILLFFGLGYFLNPPAWTGAFFLALLYFAQDFTIRQGLVGGGGTDLQSIVKGLIAAVLLLYGLFNGMTRTARHPVLLLLFAYAAFAAFSASYSSAKALGIGSGLALLAISFATTRAATMATSDLRTYWTSLYIAAVITVLLSFALLAALPMMARDLADPGAYRLRGVTGSANSLGPILTVGLIIGISMISLCKVPWKKNAHRVFFVVMLVALLLTNSRSSLIGLMVGLPAAAIIARRQSILTVLLLLLFGAAAAMVALMPSLTKGILTVFTELFSRSGHAQELTTFTGRSDIWAACIKLIKAKPWIGYGLGSVRIEIPKIFQDEWGNTAATAHNFILESLISVGVLGTVLLVLVLLATTIGLVRYISKADGVFRDAEQREWAMCALRCMLMLWVHSAVERAFAGTAAPSTVVLGVCVATYAFFALQVKAANQARLIRIRNLR